MPIGDGRQTYAYSTLKSMRKEELINVIRCLESNLINAHATLDIQAVNCKKLLLEERNKAIDDVFNALLENTKPTEKYIDSEIIVRVLKQLKEGVENDNTND